MMQNASWSCQNIDAHKSILHDRGLVGVDIAYRLAGFRAGSLSRLRAAYVAVFH